MLKLPGYEMLGSLGEGGMAKVWLARQVSLDRKVAVKSLAPELTQDASARERFLREAHAAALLNHPGIVQVHDAGEHDGALYMVMEYVPGCTVSDLLERKTRIPERHALLIAEGVALALAYAWKEARLIHCDVKPENVLVAQDGSVKLTDLGLARFIGASADPGMIEGTPHYAAPEQVRGEIDLDCRADIYSLGAMLYHLVTGQLPFGDTQGVKAMQRQVKDYLPDPTDINHALSPLIAGVIEKMMVKDRTQRYQSWEEVLADIERVKADQPPAAKPPTAGQSTVMRSESRARAIAETERRALSSQQPVRVAPPATPADEKAPAQKAGGRIAVAPAAKQKIVLPKDLRSQIARMSKADGEHDLAREVVSLLLMLMAVVISYGALGVYHYYRPAAEPVAAREATEAPAPPIARPVIARAEAAPKPAAKPAARTVAPVIAPAADESNPQNWRHPTYLKGARLFNDALEKYTQYQKTKQNPEILKSVEQQCREAIRAFEFVKPFAPKEVDIPKLIDQCYHLISDTRHSTLLAPASSSKEPTSAIVAAPPTPAAAPAAAPAAPAQEAQDLVLAPNWNAPQTGVSIRALEDFNSLLQGVAAPAADLKPDTSIVIFGQIFYLMPIQEAARLIGKPTGVRRRITAQGFPKDSFHYYSVSDNFGNGFERMLLITDNSDRIVAVQLLNERPGKDLWLDPQLFNERWSAYNFVEAKNKGNPKWKIGLRAEKDGRVVRIDSELVSHDPQGYFGLGDSKERSQLYMPEPVANLVLLRIRELQKNAAR